MADIRIKDLTTTASSSASDDFIAVDGTTNGTRKLNAFSPTFGGNATVTGTLSSAGNLSVTGTSAQIILGQTSGSQLTYLIRPAQAGGAIQIVQDANTVNRWLSLGGVDNNAVYGEGLRISSNVTIPGTTASTTTSSGALVVSGGVGVGGAINAGGEITASGATMKSVGFHVPGNGAGRPANTDSYLAATATSSIPLYVSGYTGGGQSADILRVSLNSSSDWFSVKGNGQVSCFATTASTSTSSGSLVCSGGVGVAEQIHAKYYTATSNIVAGFTANTHVLDFYSGTARNVVFGPDASTIGNWKVQLLRSDASASIDALTISNAGNGVFYGSVKTAAPSGGTAAAWKLGTVASVSPTSPNRTIEVDIGGTIYYIAAKTTNN